VESTWRLILNRYHPLSDGDTLMLVRKDTGEIIHEHVVESEENRKKRLERRYRKGQPPCAVMDG